MIRPRILTLTVILFALTACADIRESLIRNNYLSTGRAPEGWVPKKSLCPDFDHNGWQDHPPAKDGCWAPVPKVESRVPVKNTKDVQKKPVAAVDH